ncbi:MAG TPA: NAD(P)-dependent alcohol dehydrogenase [Polyangia bacterium]|nr:NAD(P)-dependent alcohol dehydrogenase [Polyangia bacterium]
MPHATRGYAATSPTSPLAPFTFSRRDVRPDDVRIEILFAGICHSDLHQARDDWGGAAYPMVPGHEILGRVVEVGANVTRFRVGDVAAVGCMVDSCRECGSCKDDLEQYCERGATWTYNGRERDGSGATQGGYSDQIVVTERFVVKVPASMDLRAVAPLLCAGITTYSPLHHWKVGPGQRVGIIGLGGLGHMGVKLAKAMGAEVTMITTSPGKGEDARRLGADAVLLSTDRARMNAAKRSFDFLLNTIPVGHDIAPYLTLLGRDRTMVLVGALTELEPAFRGNLLMQGRRSLAGSSIGGMAETQQMIDFCAAHDVVSDVEIIAIQQVNEAYERLLKNDVRYRFVIDMASLKKS